MSQSAVIKKFMQLTSIGLQAVNINLDVVEEENCVIVRDYIVDFDNGIQIFNANSPEAPFVTFPSDAFSSAASFICIQIATGIITRSIEDAETA